MLEDKQAPDAFLIVRSSDGQSEVHEINQRNFELFGKPLESGAKLTASSITNSEAAKYTLAAMNSVSSQGGNQKGTINDDYMNSCRDF